MHGRAKNILSVIVLASYVLVGAVGFWDAVGRMFQFGTHPWVIRRVKTPTPAPTKIVWTQQKHYPSSARDDVPTPATVSGWSFKLWGISSIVPLVQEFPLFSWSCSSPYFPRSPPHC